MVDKERFNKGIAKIKLVYKKIENIYKKNQGCLEKIKHKYDKNKIAKKNLTKVQQNQGCQKLNKVITKIKVDKEKLNKNI